MPQKEIAEKINVSPSTISREFRRNWLPDYDCYDSIYASLYVVNIGGSGAES